MNDTIKKVKKILRAILLSIAVGFVLMIFVVWRFEFELPFQNIIPTEFWFIAPLVLVFAVLLGQQIGAIIMILSICVLVLRFGTLLFNKSVPFPPQLLFG